MKELLSKIDEQIQQAHEILDQLRLHADSLIALSYKAATLLSQGGKILLAGNGGSLCDAAHFAQELVGFFKQKRRALPAIVLSEPGYLTCVANDVHYHEVFARGVEAYGTEQDMLIVLSTSGESLNIIHALKRAQQLGLYTVAFLGKQGGAAKGLADIEILLGEELSSDRIQEGHMMALHMVVDLIENFLFQEVYVSS